MKEREKKSQDQIIVDGLIEAKEKEKKMKERYKNALK